MIQSPPHDLRRVIGFAGGTVLIVGITIGSGSRNSLPSSRSASPMNLSPIVSARCWRW